MGGDFLKSSIVKSHESNDVLLGRGHGVSSWPGNVAFRHTVWKYREQYMNARRSDKREIGRMVTMEMKSLNGRFLIFNPKTGNFHEISEKRAEDKACQSLREKDVKIPVGFDLKAMRNRKRWFRFIMNDALVQGNDDLNALKTRKPPKEVRTATDTSKKSRRPSIASSFHAPSRVSVHKPFKKSGKRSLFDEVSLEYNDDMSLNSLDNTVYPALPLPGDPLISSRSVDGFGDDHSVLVDLKLWPEPEDYLS